MLRAFERTAALVLSTCAAACSGPQDPTSTSPSPNPTQLAPPAIEASRETAPGAPISGPVAGTGSISSNRPPVIDSINGPRSIHAGGTLTLSVAARDADGSIAAYSAEQLSGPRVPYVHMAGGVLSLRAPIVSSPSSVSLTLSATDNEGSTASAVVSVDVFPLSGNLRTLRGSLERPGIHWVVTGDGYTELEQDKLMADASRVAAYVLETPGIRSFAAPWNVHVLAVASRESGVDVPSEGLVSDTAFDGSLDCQGLQRALCVNELAVLQAITFEGIDPDHILVLSNTERWGGAGGLIVTASAHPLSGLIVLHEMGHHFAGLADEYEDAQLADTAQSIFFQGLYPNVSSSMVRTDIPWSAWLDAATPIPSPTSSAGVGVFEGALYNTTGFYRPTADSFMRSATREIGNVNLEAWAIATYDAVGAVSTAKPVSTPVVAAVGDPVEFHVGRTIGASQTVTWSLDGQPLRSSLNDTTVVCCDTIGSHVLEVRRSEEH